MEVSSNGKPNDDNSAACEAVAGYPTKLWRGYYARHLNVIVPLKSFLLKGNDWRICRVYSEPSLAISLNSCKQKAPALRAISLNLLNESKGAENSITSIEKSRSISFDRRIVVDLATTHQLDLVAKGKRLYRERVENAQCRNRKFNTITTASLIASCPEYSRLGRIRRQSSWRKTSIVTLMVVAAIVW